MKAPIAVPLDTRDLATAELWAKAVSPHVQVLKVGLELFCAHGPAVVEAVSGDADVFLDSSCTTSRTRWPVPRARSRRCGRGTSRCTPRVAPTWCALPSRPRPR